MNRYDAVIFDMDGTLIEPMLDFAAIRRELNIPPGRGVLEGIDEMPPLLQGQAYQALLAHELHAARSAGLMDGVDEVLAELARRSVRTALLTRNTRQAVEIVLQRFPQMRFEVIRSREDGIVKPQPDGMAAICHAMKLRPHRCLAVGDFHYDIQAANAAGAESVLLCPGELPEWAGEADFVIRRLAELLALLEAGR
jgi:HAD superfamily hydrolase (TIGR01509 family)